MTVRVSDFKQVEIRSNMLGIENENQSVAVSKINRRPNRPHQKMTLPLIGAVLILEQSKSVIATI